MLLQPSFTDSNNNTLDYWQQPIDDKMLTISDDVPYLRQSTRNLRFHHPVDAVVLKATSGTIVKKSLQVDERKTIKAIMDEIKNMLDYKVGHYVHYNDITSANKQNVLRSFVFIKQKIFPNG